MREGDKLKVNEGAQKKNDKFLEKFMRATK